MISDTIAVLLPLYHTLQRLSFFYGLDIVFLPPAVHQTAQERSHSL